MNISGYRIGILCAMESEFRIIHDAIEGMNPERVMDCKYYIGKINNAEVVLVRCGVGKVNAAAATTVLIDHFECNLILNSGIAGGIRPTKTRDLIIADRLIYNDVDIVNFGYKYGQIPGMPEYFHINPSLLIFIKSILNRLNMDFKCGVIASGDKFARSLDIIKDNEKDILAVDMESTAVAQVATKAGVDFLIVRYVSDIVGEESQIEKYDEFEEEMADNSAKVTLSLINALE